MSAQAARRKKMPWRARHVYYGVKVDTLPVNDAKGHTLALASIRGLGFLEGGGVYVINSQAISDVTNGLGVRRGYGEATFEDGAKAYFKFISERKSLKENFKGHMTFLKGTGRLRGIQGEGTFEAFDVPPDLIYTNLVGEYSLPG